MYSTFRHRPISWATTRLLLGLVRLISKTFYLRSSEERHHPVSVWSVDAPLLDSSDWKSAIGWCSYDSAAGALPVALITQTGLLRVFAEELALSGFSFKSSFPEDAILISKHTFFLETSICHKHACNLNL